MTLQFRLIGTPINPYKQCASCINKIDVLIFINKFKNRCRPTFPFTEYTNLFYEIVLLKRFKMCTKNA